MQLSLAQIEHRAGAATHLYPLSLTLTPGTVSVLLGATQAGKTTLMRLDRKSTRLNSSHLRLSRMPSSA